MSSLTPPNGTDSPSDIPAVTCALRQLVDGDGRVALHQLASAAGLTPADAEAAMGSIERVAPVSVQRIVEPGADVAWRVSL